LPGIVTSYKSKAVQLRAVDLVLGGREHASRGDTKPLEEKPASRRRDVGVAHQHGRKLAVKVDRPNLHRLRALRAAAGGLVPEQRSHVSSMKASSNLQRQSAIS